MSVIPFYLYIALTAGMVAAFNPCGVVLLPAYVSYLMTQKTINYTKTRLLLLGIRIGFLMALGFISIFFFSGLLISLVGTYIMHYVPWITVVIGIIFFLAGIIFLLKPKNIVMAASISRWGPLIQGKNKFNYYFYGIGYAIVSLGCTLPIFMVMVFSSITTGNFYEGLAAFIFYGLGMGIVVTVITILSLFAKTLVEKWIKRIIPYIHKVAAVFILLTGVYLVYYWLLGPGQLLN